MEGVLVSPGTHSGAAPPTYAPQMKPIEGAESEGALGFFKGVGKGLVGYVRISIAFVFYLADHSSSAVTKPVVGVFDLASNVSEGKSMSFVFFFLIRNADRTQVFEIRRPCLITRRGIEFAWQVFTQPFRTQDNRLI